MLIVFIFNLFSGIKKKKKIRKNILNWSNCSGRRASKTYSANFFLVSMIFDNFVWTKYACHFVQPKILCSILTLHYHHRHRHYPPLPLQYLAPDNTVEDLAINRPLSIRRFHRSLDHYCLWTNRRMSCIRDYACAYFCCWRVSSEESSIDSFLLSIGLLYLQMMDQLNGEG